MNEERQGLNSRTGAWVLTMIAIAIIVPFFWHRYIQPIYVAGWYYYNLGIFKGLVFASHHSHYFAMNSDSILFWVNWVIIGSDLPPHTLTGQIFDSYNILQHTNTDHVIYIYRTYVYRHGDYKLDFEMVSRLGYAIMFPVYLFISGCLIRKILNHKDFTTVFTLDSFATTLAEGFPENLPVVWDNPLKESDLDKGCWSMSPKILPYLREHGCILDSNDNGDDKISLDVDATRELLVEQLGRRWAGFSSLTDNERLVVALALPMIKSPKEGRKTMESLVLMYGYSFSGKPNLPVKLKACLNELRGVVNPIALLSSKGKNIFKFISSVVDIKSGLSESMRRTKYKVLSKRAVDAVFKKYAQQECVANVIKGHAYTYTVIAALLRKAREGGKLPSCTCIWLKKRDRRLFYVFNNLGREVCWIECVGFWSHEMSERKIGVPFSYPRIDAGISGIDEYLWSSYYEYKPIADWDAVYAE